MPLARKRSCGTGCRSTAKPKPCSSAATRSARGAQSPSGLSDGNQEEERPAQAARQAHPEQPQQAPALDGRQLAAEAQRAAEVAREDGGRAGGVGRDHRHAGVDEGREGEEGPAARDRVEGAREQGRGAEDDGFGHNRRLPGLVGRQAPSSTSPASLKPVMRATCRRASPISASRLFPSRRSKASMIARRSRPRTAMMKGKPNFSE